MRGELIAMQIAAGGDFVAAVGEGKEPASGNAVFRSGVVAG